MTNRKWGDWLVRIVGDVVAEDYRLAAVFDEFGIDYCCGGRRTVAAACHEAGADPSSLSVALTAAAEAAGPGGPGGPGVATSNPATWDLRTLAGYIVAVHHAYVRQSAPLLREITTKLATVHGERHPELHQIRDTMTELADELGQHMEEEEEVLFPRISELVGASATDAANLQGAVTPLEDDHTRAGDLMRRIRELSDDYSPPADGCSTYATGFARLADFEADLHRHVHLENNVLFPRALELERSLASAAAAGSCCTA